MANLFDITFKPIMLLFTINYYITTVTVLYILVTMVTTYSTRYLGNIATGLGDIVELLVAPTTQII